MTQDDARLAVASRPVQLITMGRLPGGPLQVIGLGAGRPRLVSWQVPDNGSWRSGQTLPSRGWFSYSSLVTIVDRRGNLVVFGLATDGTPHLVCTQRLADSLWATGRVINGLPHKSYTMIAAGLGRDGAPYLCGIADVGSGGLPEIIAVQDLSGQWNYGGQIAPAAVAGRYRSLVTVTSPIASPQIIALATDEQAYRVSIQNPDGGWRYDGAKLPWPFNVPGNATFTQLVVGLGNGALKFPQLLGITDGVPVLICWADGENWHPGSRLFGPDHEKFASLCAVPGAQSRLDLIALSSTGAAYLVAYQDSAGKWAPGQPLSDGSNRKYSSLAVAAGNSENVQVVGLTGDGGAFLITWQNARDASWNEGGPFPQPPPPLLDLPPREQTALSGTNRALTTTRLGTSQVLTGVTMDSGKLRLIAWMVDRTGVFTRQGTASVEPAAQYAGMAPTSPGTFLVAYKNLSGTLTVSSWSVDAAGTLTHLSDFTSGYPVSFADGIDNCRIGVATLSDDIWVTAHRSDTGALVLASWHLGRDGAVTAVTSTVGPDISTVQVVAIGSGAVITAVRLAAGDELQLQRWHVDDVFITEAATTGPQGAIAANLRLSTDPAGNLLTAVIPSQQPGELRLVAWRADARGRFRRFGEGGDEAGSVTTFDITSGFNGQLTVAACDDADRLSLSLWQIDRDGQITWLGSGMPLPSQTAAGSPASPVLMPEVIGAAPVIAGFLAHTHLRLRSFAIAQGWNHRLTNVESAFRAVAKDGHAERVTAVWPYLGLIGDHLQGMAMYKEFVFLTKNVYFGDGMLLVASRATQTVLDTFSTPDGRHHPAGCQVLGDYLAMAIESNSSSDGKVRFYDLTNLSEAHPQPKLMSQPQITCTAGAGAVGVADVGSHQDRRIIVAVYDRGNIGFHRSTTTRLSDQNCGFEHLFDTERAPSEHLQHVQNISLVTDAVGGLHLVVFATTQVWGDIPDEDWMGLYRVDLEAKQLQYVAERHMYTDSDSLSSLWSSIVFHSPASTSLNMLESSVHFRWGAGLSILSDTELMIYCCQRNFVKAQLPWRLQVAINSFRT